MRSVCILFLLLACCCRSQAQLRDSARVYHVKTVYELGGATALLVASSFGFKALDRVSTLYPEDLAALNPQDVNSFDRSIIFKDPARAESSQSKADLFLNISIASPVLLMLDGKIRKDWLDLLSLYLVTHVVDNAVYFAVAFPIRRPRPFTYNTDIPVSLRAGEAKTNSFFSGHTSFSATSTFFLAKVFTDYHHIKGWQRLGIYTVAAIPPALVGYYRVQAARHFKTDIMLGFVIGAASGILVPELHRRLNQVKHLSVSPYVAPTGQAGFCLNYRFH